MSVAYDIMGNLIQEGDLICSCWRKDFDVRVVRKITSSSVMYHNLNSYARVYNLKRKDNYIDGLKVTTAQLSKDYLEEYQELMKTIKKDVATADNT